MQQVIASNQAVGLPTKAEARTNNPTAESPDVTRGERSTSQSEC